MCGGGKGGMVADKLDSERMRVFCDGQTNRHL